MLIRRTNRSFKSSILTCCFVLARNHSIGYYALSSGRHQIFLAISYTTHQRCCFNNYILITSLWLAFCKYLRLGTENLQRKAVYLLCLIAFVTFCCVQAQITPSHSGGPFDELLMPALLPPFRSPQSAPHLGFSASIVVVAWRLYDESPNGGSQSPLKP